MFELSGGDISCLAEEFTYFDLHFPGLIFDPPFQLVLFSVLLAFVYCFILSVDSLSGFDFFKYV